MEPWQQQNNLVNQKHLPSEWRLAAENNVAHLSSAIFSTARMRRFIEGTSRPLGKNSVMATVLVGGLEKYFYICMLPHFYAFL